MKKRVIVILFLILLSSMSFPLASHAGVPNSLKTYVVWNQFDATVNTFKRIGLIMSDSRYTGLFTGIIVFAMIIGGFYTVGVALLSGHNPLYAWLKWFGIIMVGIIVYLTFIRPTTQITIYDEALNETMTVGGIPEGIVFIAGLANTIERGFVDMIWTAGNPQSYRENAGGLTLSIYEKAFSGGVDLSGGSPDGQYINMSLRQYIKDCVYFEIRRPGSTININDFNTTTDFRPILANAQNPAIYTIWYDNTHRSGLTVTCTEAWQNHLAPYLNSLTNSSPDVVKFSNERCGEVGMGANSQAGGSVNLVNVCVQKAENMTPLFFGASFSMAHLFRQYVIARALFDVYTESAPSSAMAVLSSRAAGNSMIGMGIMANEWIPIIRSVVFSIFIGMIPFLCLLIPTPLFGRAISFLVGIFVFLTVWTICDALVHSFAVDKMLDIFKEISDGNLGFKSMMLFSTDSAKALAAFGAARWSAIMLGGVFSSILVKFGGSALAHFAGNLSAYKQYGAQAAESVNNPSRWASEVQSLPQVRPSIAYANAGFDRVAAALTYDTVSRLGTSIGATAALGGGNPVTAGLATAEANVTGIKEGVAHSGAIKAYAQAHGMTENQVISAVQNYRTASSAGTARGLQRLANDLHTSIYGAMDFMKEMGLKKEYGQAQGLKQAYDRAVQKAGYTGSFTDYVAMQSELQGERGYFDAAAVDKYSKLYKGGREAFLRDQAEFRTSQAESMLKKMRESGITPGSVAQTLGALQGMRNLVDSAVYSKVGDRGVWITRAGEQYNELSKMVLRKAVEDLAKTGRLSNDTRKMLQMLKSDHIAASQLQSQEANTSFVISPEEAHNFGELFRKHGSDVTDSELSGSTVNAAWVADRNGDLAPVMVATKRGQKIAEMDLREKDYGSIQRGIKPGKAGSRRGNGWQGTFAGYHFISGERRDMKGPDGDLVRIHGVTADGHIVDLIGTTSGGKEQVVTKTVKQGPKYEGTLFMAADANVPVEVFRDTAAGAIFAQAYSKELSNVYQGKLSKEDAVRVIQRLGGRLGLGAGFGLGPRGSSTVNIGGRISGAKEKQNVEQRSATSATDVITQAAMAINRSDMTIRQKEQAYQELTRMLISVKREHPEDLPGAEVMLHDGENPFGEIKNTPDDRGGLEKIKDVLFSDEDW